MIPLAKKQPQIDPLLLKIQATKQAIDRLECQKSCRKFIKRHVKIYDPDIPGSVFPFKLWLRQLLVLRIFLHCRLVLVLKARQLGLTWLALAYIIWKMLFRPGFTVAAVSTTEDKAKELVKRLKFILERLPAHIVRPAKGCDPRYTGPTWDSTTATITICHKGGVDATFTALTASPDAARSLIASLILLDESAFHDAAEEIWSAAVPTINRPTGGQLFAISTMKIGSIFHQHCEAAREGRSPFRFVFLGRWTDPRRDQAWFETSKQLLPNTWKREYPETYEEACSVGEGAFFPEWQEDVHVPLDHWAPPRSAAWPIIGVYDPAWNQACFCWYTVSPGVPGFSHGWARKFREIAPVHMTAYDQAREILRLSCYRDGKTAIKKDPYGGEDIEIPGTPYVFKYIIGDTRAWAKGDDSGISTEEVFRKYGLIMRQATKGLEAGWMELHEWLKHRPDPDVPPGPDGRPKMTAKLTFTRDCGYSLRTYPACEQSKTNPEDISSKTPHDPQDCDMYFVQSRVKAADIKPDPLEELAKKYPAWTPQYMILSQEILRGDRKREVRLEDLGM